MQTTTLKILMLEDMAADAGIIQRVLTKSCSHYEFRVVMSKDDFIEELNHYQPDVVLSDNDLPQFTGAEALKILQQSKQNVPFILVTGNVSEEFAVEIIKAGADDYLLKDRLSRLPAAIEQALSKKKSEKEKSESVERLRESEERYRDIVENISDILCTHDLEGKVYTVNEAARQQLGYEIEDMLKMNIRDILSARSKEGFGDYICSIKANGFYKGLMGVKTITGESRIWEVNNSLKAGGTEKPMVRGFARDVTERVIAEKKLADSERRFRALIENSNEAITLLDESFQVLYQSPASIGINGWSSEELKNTRSSLNIHPDDILKIKSVFSESLKSPGIAVPYLTRYFDKDGKYLWAEGTFTNMLHIDGVNAVVANYRDITRRKETEEKLIANEKQFRNSLDNMLEGVQIIGFDWKFIYVNNALAKHSTYPKNELLGYTLMEKYPGIEDTETFRVLQRCFKERVAIQLENEFEFPDKSKGWFELSIQPVPEGVFVLSVDITERKKTEKILSEEKDKFTKIAATSPGLIYSMRLNKQGVLSYPYSSDAIKDIYGFKFEEIKNAPDKIFALIHQDDVDSVMAAVKETKTKLIPLKSEYRYHHPSKGLVWHEVNSLPVKEADGAVICHGIVIDITERKKAEQKILKTSRLYAFISQVNQMIVRTTDKEMLFKEACNIAVEFGKFKMAWIGLIDENAAQIVPVQHSGEELGYLSRLKTISTTDLPEGSGPTGRAIKEGKSIVCNDIENDIQMAPWEEDALSRGYLSSIALPIKVFGKVIGAFNFYAGEKYFFDAEEIKLLEEATGDVGFALEIFEKEILRKKAEEKLIASEERYHNLTEISPVGIFRTDADGFTTYVNPKWSQISGITREAALGLGWLNAVHPDDRIQLITNWEKAKKDQQFKLAEYRFLYPDGSIRWVIGQVIPEKDASDKIVGYVGTATDISERKEAEEEIKAANDRFDTIARATNDAVFEYDLLTGKSWHNESFLQLFNSTNSAELINPDSDQWKAKIHPDDRQRVIAKLQASIASQSGTWSDEFRFQKADGSYGIFYDRAMIERDPSGKAVKLMGSMAEVTELKKAEEKLLQQKVQLETLSNNLPGILIYQVVREIDGRINFTYISKGVTPLTGKSPQEILENPDILYDLILKEDFPKFVAAQKKSLINMSVFSVEVRCFTYEGEIRWLSIISTPRKMTDGRVVWDGFHVDITERKKAEEALHESKETFSKIFYLNPSVCALNDLNNDRFVDVNDAFVNFFGFTKAEVIGKTSEELGIMMPEIRKNLLGKMDEHGIEHNMEATVKTKAGVKKEVLISTSNIYIKDKEYAYTVSNDITERKLAEEEIKNSEEKRRLIMNAALDAIVCMDTQGFITFWNPRAEKIFGWKEAEVMNCLLSDIIIPEPFRKMHDKGLENYVKTGQGKAVNILLELKAINRQKEEFPVELTVLPIKQNNEEFFCAFIRDITERKAAIEAIKASEEKYRVLIEEASEAIFISDATGRFKIVNSSACKLSQYSEEELLTMTIFDFLVEDDIAEQPLRLNELKEGKTVVTERVMKRKDGNFNHLEVTSKLLTDGRLLSLVRDVAERKKAEAAILLSNERYNLVSKATNDSVWEMDIATDEITRTGDGFKTLFGYEKESANDPALHWNNLVHPDDFERVKQSELNVFNNPDEHFWEQEYRFLKASGQYAFVYDKGYIIRDEKGKAIRMIGATQDITRIKENETNLKRLNDNLLTQAVELADSNAELEQFAYVASHDLQEPLRMVTSFLVLLEKKYKDSIDDTGKKYIHFAVDGAKRMRQIILDLLDFSRIGRSDIEVRELNLYKLINEIELLYSKQIDEKNATIIKGPLPLINAPEAPLRQLFQNLISNALKYSRKDIPVQIHISAESFDDCWQFSVADNGIGINEEYHEKIFVIFQRLHNKEEFSGTGIGLAVTKKIIEKLGGRIWIASTEGKGSTFYFTLKK